MLQRNHTPAIPQRSFYCLVTALFLWLISGSLFTDGMFTDGVIYAVVSRNLAAGLGSPWDLHYTATLYPHFHEHPPLAFWIQALLFRLFGDHLYVERIYSAGTFLVMAFCLVLIWKKVSPGGNENQGWLPLLFWISAPPVTWAASNNLLENTLMVFTGFAVFLILKGMTGKERQEQEGIGSTLPTVKQSLNLVLAGILLGCGMLTKGFVAIFPLSLPFWIFVFRRRIPFGKFAAGTLLPLIGIIILLLPVTLLMPGSREYLTAYLDSQVVHSLSSVRTVGSRFHIVGTLVLSTLPGMGLLLVTWMTAGRRSHGCLRNSWFYVFLSLGLSGVLPIMISLKQRDFYILPALSMMAIALAIAAAPSARVLLRRLKTRWYPAFRIAGILLLAGGLTLVSLRAGKPGRDRELLRDVVALVEEIPRGISICIPRELFDDWDLHAYLQRYGGISLDPVQSCAGDYYLTPLDFKATPDPRCSEPELGLARFRLFTCSPMSD